MKKMKKLAAMLIAVVMAMSLAVPAMAEGTGGTIKVTSPSTTSTTTYSIYKMFDIETTTGGKYKYKVTTDWTDFINQTSVSNYIQYQNGYVLWQKATTSESDGAALAELAKKYVTEKNFVALKTVQVSNSVSVNDNGYYLLVPPANVKSACGVVAVVGGETVNVIEKTFTPGLPNVEKTVQEDSNSNYFSSNTADVGGTVRFKVIINAADNASNYILHDEMDDCFSFIAIESVKNDGKALSADTDYTFTSIGNDFTIKFDETVCSTLKDNATITVIYTAKLNYVAANVYAETGHKNTAWLTHTAENIPTGESTTATYTYKIDVTKVDQDEAPLAGAGFKLKDNNNNYYKWVKPANPEGASPYVEWVTDASDATELTTGADGKITFDGVDAEDFTLIESTVPGGYTGKDDVSVSTKSASDGTTGQHASVKVTNTLGTALPETGGMGTTIFYIAGSILMLGAAVLLLTKKRTKAE